MYGSKIFRTVLCLIMFSVSAALAADVSSVFSGSEFGFPPLLQHVKFGMTDDEMKQAAPDFKSDYYFTVHGNEGIRIEKDMSGGSLSSIRIKFAPEFTEVADFFQERWGAAKTAQQLDGTTVYHWLNRDAGMRAKLEKQWDEMVLTYYQYIPFETLFPEPVPMLPTPLTGMQIGLPLATVIETIPEFQSSRWVDLKGYCDVRIWHNLREDSTIKYFSVSFPDLENVRDRLIEQWGTPETNDSGKDYWHNETLEYLDPEGNIQKGIFVIYQPGIGGTNHVLDFTPDLYDYEY